jgi:hypothetical protein
MKILIISLDNTHDFGTEKPSIRVTPQNGIGEASLRPRTTGVAKKRNNGDDVTYTFLADNEFQFKQVEAATTLAFSLHVLITTKGDSSSGTLFDGKGKIIFDLNHEDIHTLEDSLHECPLEDQNGTVLGIVSYRMFFSDDDESAEYPLEENILEEQQTGSPTRALAPSSPEVGSPVAVEQLADSHPAAALTSKEKRDLQSSTAGEFERQEPTTTKPQREGTVSADGRRKRLKKAPNWTREVIRSDALAGLLETDARPLAAGTYQVQVCGVVSQSADLPASLVVRTCLLPLPAKKSVVRCQQSSSVRRRIDGLTVVKLSGKNVSLLLTQSELRSKVFHNGACARLDLELTGGGSTWTTAVYLPALVRDFSGGAVVVPLAQQQTIGSDSASANSGFIALVIALRTPDQQQQQQQQQRQGIPPAIGLPRQQTNVQLEVLGLLGSGFSQASLLRVSVCGGATGQALLSLGALFKGGLNVGARTRLRADVAPGLAVLRIELLERVGGPEGRLGLLGDACLPLAHSAVAQALGPSVLAGFLPDSDGRLLQKAGWEMVVRVTQSTNDLDSSGGGGGGASIVSDAVALGALTAESAVEKLAAGQTTGGAEGESASVGDSLKTTEEELMELDHFSLALDDPRATILAPAPPSHGRSAVSDSPVKRRLSTSNQVDDPTVSGSCHVTIQGFVPESAEQDVPVIGRDELCVTELVYLPQGIRKRTSAQPFQYSTGDANIRDPVRYIDWSHAVDLDTIHSLKQRSVGVFRFELLYVRGRKDGQGRGKDGKQTRSDKDSRRVGVASLDLAAIFKGTVPSFCVLQVRAPSAQHGRLGARIGWLFLVVEATTERRPQLTGTLSRRRITQYNSAAALEGSKRAQEIQRKFNTQWISLLDSPTNFLFRSAITTSRPTIHISARECDFDGGAGFSPPIGPDGTDTSGFPVLLTITSSAGTSECLLGHVQDSVVFWKIRDSLVSLESMLSLSTTVHLALHVLPGGAAAEEAAIVALAQGKTTDTPLFSAAYADPPIGSATVLLSRDRVNSGVPMHLLVPLRNKSDSRTTIIELYAQLSAGASDINGDNSAADHSQGPARGASVLDISLVEGRVQDRHWSLPMELYFVCRLLTREGAADAYNDPATTREAAHVSLAEGHTAFSKEPDLQESPLNCFLGLAHTPTADLEECVVSITCHDAARQGCPVVSSALVGLPRTILKGTAVEIWATFSSSGSGGGSGNRLDSLASTETETYSDNVRLLLQLAHDDKTKRVASIPGATAKARARNNRSLMSPVGLQAPPAVPWPGLGTVLLWIVGAHQARRHYENQPLPLSFASVAGTTVQTQVTDKDGLPFISVPVASSQAFIPIEASTALERNALSFALPVVQIVGSRPLETGIRDTGFGAKTASLAFHEIELTQLPEVGASSDGGVSRQQKHLRVRAAFVPFIEGDLLLSAGRISLNTRAAPFERGVLRYTMAGQLNTFSSPVDVALPGTARLDTSRLSVRSTRSVETALSKSGGGAIGRLGSAARANKATGSRAPFSQIKPATGTSSTVGTGAAVTLDSATSGATFEGNQVLSVRLDTLDLSSPTESMSLEVRLLNSDATATEETYCAGVTRISTAPLYWEAIKQAATSSVAAPINVGHSEWHTIEAKLTHPSSGAQVGSVELRLKFIFRGVSPSAAAVPVSSGGTAPPQAAAIGALGGGSSKSESLANARTELVLKQAFVASDEDGSGDVDAGELAQILASLLLSGPSAHNSSGGTGQSLSLGDDARSLLEGLLRGADDGEVNNYEAIKQRVSELFSRVDLSGQGSLSWWLWQHLLLAELSTDVAAAAASTGTSPTPVVDTRDPLLLFVKAAASAVAGISTEDQMGPGEAIQGAGGHDPDPEATRLLQSDSSILSLGSLTDGVAPPAKVVRRLKRMIKSLRATNSGLMQKLETAIIQSQTVSDQAAGGHVSAAAASAAAAAVTRTQDEARLQSMGQSVSRFKQEAVKSRELFVLEHARAKRLELELSEAKDAQGAAFAAAGTEQGSAEKEGTLTRRNLHASSSAALLTKQDLLREELYSHFSTKKAHVVKLKHAKAVLTRLFRAAVERIRARKEAESRNVLERNLGAAVRRRQAAKEEAGRHTAGTTVQK